MKKIKLKESDIERLVKKIIKEDGSGIPNLNQYLNQKSEEVENGGGNYIHIDELQNVASHLEHYKHNSPRQLHEEQGWYTDETLNAFIKLVDSIASDEINLNPSNTLEKHFQSLVSDDEEGEHTQDEMNDVWEELNSLGVDYDEMMEATFNEGSMSVESFVSYLPGYMGYSEEYLISVLKQIQDEGI